MNTGARRLIVVVVVGLLFVLAGYWGGSRLYGLTLWATGSVTALFDGTFTADDLVQDLMGPGVTFSNVTLQVTSSRPAGSRALRPRSVSPTGSS